MSSEKFPKSIQAELLDMQILAEAAERDLDPNRQQLSILTTGRPRTEAFDEKAIQVLGIGPFLERYGSVILLVVFFIAFFTGHLNGLVHAFIQTR